MLMFQCDLTQPDLSKRVRWVNEVDAIRGKMVELDDEPGLWKVNRVYQPGINYLLARQPKVAA